MDWPREVVFVSGRPCNPQCQGLIEQGVEKMLGYCLQGGVDRVASNDSM